MSEHSITMHIGEDIQVTVWFDYQPFESADGQYPGCFAEVYINAVNLADDEKVEIVDILSKDVLDSIRSKCFSVMEPTNEPN